jgi:hypothetical protein
MNLPDGNLLLELHWKKAVVATLTPNRVTKHLDGVEYVSPGLFSGCIDSALGSVPL